MTRRRLVPWFVVLLGLAFGAALHHVPPRLTSGAWLPPKPDAALRLLSWNVRNFRADDHDLAWMRGTIARASPDVIAFQEVLEPEALARIVPGHTLHTTERGGRHGQKLALAYDPTRVTLLEPPFEDAAISLEGKVRPALVARLARRTAGALPFELVIVHLKATPSGHDERLLQWERLRALVAERAEPRTIVLGDFNATGAKGGMAADERARLEDMLGAVGLRRLTIAGGCTAYWQGVRFDAWVEPTLLDLVFVGPGWDARAFPHGAAALSHCARHRCLPFQSSESYPERSLASASDHCPVVFDVVEDARTR